ncbi:hypothetical protein ACYX7E_10025 [Luteimonas sp. RIT-PG2_3]
MNLIAEDVEDVVHGIQIRMLRKSGGWAVYVDRAGKVRMEAVNEPRKNPLPDDDLVGVYTRKASEEDMEDDLVVRLREIADPRYRITAKGREMLG